MQRMLTSPSHKACSNALNVNRKKSAKNEFFLYFFVRLVEGSGKYLYCQKNK